MTALLEKQHAVRDASYRKTEDLIPRRVGVVADTGALCFIGSAAGRTALRLIGKTFSLVELLFAGRESERCFAVYTLD